MRSNLSWRRPRKSRVPQISRTRSRSPATRTARSIEELRESRNIVMAKNTSVYGMYNNRVDVERAVDALRAAGFRNTDISVLFSENVGTKDFAHEKGTKAPEGAATG